MSRGILSCVIFSFAMSNNSLEAVYKRLQEKKRKRRDLNKSFQDELSVHPRYQEIVEELKKLREEKKSIENEVRSSADVAELEALKADIKGDMEMLADITLNKFLAQENVEIVDDFNTRWVPAFSVRFKKE